MKAILMSIRPRWVAKILNGEKTIEIRKRFPKDYVGWVYIYCTKEKPRAILTDKGVIVANTLTVGGNSQYKSGYSLSGRVVARFWCDKVEGTKPYMDKEQQKLSCLSTFELMEYLQGKAGYAIHITKLEIFDKPKEISEFYKASCKGCPFENTQTCHNDTSGRYCKLTRAPQSWCYIEI